MSGLVDLCRHGYVFFMNEAFSSTNEWDASNIGGQIVKGLNKTDNGVFYVTHMYELAERLSQQKDVVSLRVERKEDGSRTYKIKRGNPEAASMETTCSSRCSANR